VRALILGGAGMLGHKLWQHLRTRMTVYVTLRRSQSAYARMGLFEEQFTIDNVDVTNPHDLHRAFSISRPEVVFNAVGIIKQLKQAHDPVTCITVNSLFPHQLRMLCAVCGARLIHISTDCVFSGKKGNYTEQDVPDPQDLYGRSKLLGEVCAPGSVTVRTSMIGRELETQSGLIEWFLSQRGGQARGFQRAIYTGFTTQELARILAFIAEEQPNLSGVWNVSSDPISKFDLLTMVNRVYGLGIQLEPDNDFVCDRSMDSSRFREATGYRPPDWSAMIREMYEDPTPYEAWRKSA
jgi:dTDP-4-dehydrorhamnose reductase